MKSAARRAKPVPKKKRMTDQALPNQSRMATDVGKATTEKVIKAGIGIGIASASVVKEDYSQMFVLREWLKLKDKIVDLSRRCYLRSVNAYSACKKLRPVMKSLKSCDKETFTTICLKGVKKNMSFTPLEET
jgi:hypothetical protein